MGDAPQVDLDDWWQGDVLLQDVPPFFHLADLSWPITPFSEAAAAENPSEENQDWLESISAQPEGIVVVSQTCDIVLSDRPFVEISPLAIVDPGDLEKIKRMRQPGFAYVPGVAHRNLVAYLDMTMTVSQKALFLIRTRPITFVV